MTRLGIVTGLALEARILRKQFRRTPATAGRPAMVVAGADPVRARDAADALIADGVDALISFGIAGGLDPAHRPGQAILAARVILPDGGAVETDAAWTGRLAEIIGRRCRVTIADMAGSDRPVATPAAKAELFRTTGGAAVDMESHAVAMVAATAGIPFCVIRAVADPATRALPEWVSAAVSSDGKTRALPVLIRMTRKPNEFGNMMRLAGDSRAATRVLRRVASLCAPGFGLG